MDVTRFSKSPIGDMVPIVVADGGTQWRHFAYVPKPLPNAVVLSDPVWAALLKASNALARLDGAANRLPNPYHLVRPAMTEEAVSTSALEGTYAPLQEVLTAEFADRSTVSAEAIEIRNFVTAAERGFELAKNQPISLNVIKELHGVLMAGARGDSFESGEFRRGQNWIGRRRSDPITDALFVPPPPGEPLIRGLGAWEKWINLNDLPLLIKVALGHYQFETLHPFTDGNGRLGRLVTLLMLVASGELRVPLLNLSPYLQEHRDAYIDHLRNTSLSGKFEPWILFFLEVVSVQAERSLVKADRLMGLRDELVGSVHEAKLRGIAVRIAEDLTETPVFSIRSAANRYNVTFQAVDYAVGNLEKIGIVQRIRTYEPKMMLVVAPTVIDAISSK